MQRDKYNFNTDAYLLELAKSSCSNFIKERKYVMQPQSQEEADFPLAFGIRLHKNGAQAEQLLRMLYQPQNVYCIHIDIKSSARLHNMFRAITKCFLNVFIMSRPVNYKYGSSSPVTVDNRCMEDLLERKEQWKYFMNVAGQEFPLKTNLEMVRIMKELNGANDIESFPLLEHFHHRVEFVSIS